MMEIKHSTQRKRERGNTHTHTQTHACNLHAWKIKMAKSNLDALPAKKAEMMMMMKKKIQM